MNEPNFDDNVPQRELRDRLDKIEQVLGYVMNILHFVITDNKIPYTEGTRESIWRLIDEAIAIQNNRTEVKKSS